MERPLIKESLLVLNLWGLHPKSQTKLAKSRTTFLFGLIIYFSIELALQLLLKWRGLGSIDGASSTAVCCQVTVKVILMIANRNLINLLLNRMERFWFLNKADMELQLEIKAIYRIAKKCMVVFVFFVACTSLGYFLKPFLTIPRNLPFDGYHPIDRYRSPQYQIQYIVQIFSIAAGASLMIGFDSLFLSFVIHITCQLKMIKQGFSTIPVRGEANGDDKSCLNKVKELIEHHNLVLGCVKYMDKIYCMGLLNQFATCGICICMGLVGIIASGFPPSLQDLLKYIAYLGTFSSQLFIYCGAGSYLIAEANLKYYCVETNATRKTFQSESVSEAVFESNWWIKTQPQLRRAFVLVIQRANKTEKLTAGGMFVLDLESFARIIKTSLSFFTLVKAMYSRTSDAQ